MSEKAGGVMSGKVVHFELPADDLARAESFYGKVFGWTMRSVPGMDYTLVTTTPTNEEGVPTEPGAINGGMVRRQPPVQAPVVVIHVGDMDATLRTVEAHGGQVVRSKFQVGEVGFAAYFKDSEGNTIGLWQEGGR